MVEDRKKPQNKNTKIDLGNTIRKPSNNLKPVSDNNKKK